MVEGRVAGEICAEDGGASFDSGPEDHGYYCCYKEGVLLVEVLVGDGEGGGLTAEVCSEAAVDVDLDEDYGVDEAGYGGYDAAVYTLLVHSVRRPWGERANVQYPQPKDTNNPRLLALTDLQFPHETSRQA